jgi:hypothetical protein
MLVTASEGAPSNGNQPALVFHCSTRWKPVCVSVVLFHEAETSLHWRCTVPQGGNQSALALYCSTKWKPACDSATRWNRPALALYCSTRWKPVCVSVVLFYEYSTGWPNADSQQPNHVICHDSGITPRVRRRLLEAGCQSTAPIPRARPRYQAIRRQATPYIKGAMR